MMELDARTIVEIVVIFGSLAAGYGHLRAKIATLEKEMATKASSTELNLLVTGLEKKFDAFRDDLKEALKEIRDDLKGKHA